MAMTQLIITCNLQDESNQLTFELVGLMNFNLSLSHLPLNPFNDNQTESL